MTHISLNDIVLSSQELDAIHNILVISCEAFKLAKYPDHRYHIFLRTIHNLIQQGAMIASLTKTTLLRYKEFSLELDKLSSFMRVIDSFEWFKK